MQTIENIYAKIITVKLNQKSLRKRCSSGSTPSNANIEFLLFDCIATSL
jgi:translation initiation factor 1 (eIF-1/SUI1)